MVRLLLRPNIISKAYEKIVIDKLFMKSNKNIFQYDISIKDCKYLITQASSVNLIKNAYKLFYSIKSLHIRKLLCRNTRRIINNIEKIYDDLIDNNDIKKISLQYMVPPMNIYRVILKYIFKLNKPSIRQILKPVIFYSESEKQSYEILKTDEIRRILEHSKKQNKLDIPIFVILTLIHTKHEDGYTFIDEDAKFKKSIEYESDIEQILIDHEIEYITQTSTVTDQLKSGPIKFSPDFIITSDLYVNNLKINWIEVKNHYGISTDTIQHAIKKQVNKYVRHLGSGLLLFKYGISDEIQYEDVIIGNLNDTHDGNLTVE